MKKEFNFSKAFNELRKITEEFESGKVDLDEGIKKFERGLELASLCRQRLKEVENKIIEIKEKFTKNDKSKKLIDIELKNDIDNNLF